MKQTKLTTRQLDLENYLNENRGRYHGVLEITLAVAGYPQWKLIKYESNGAAYRQVISDMEAINSLGTKGIMITDGHYGFRLADSPKEAYKEAKKHLKALRNEADKFNAILDKMNKDGTYDLLKKEFTDIYGRFEEIEKELEDEE